MREVTLLRVSRRTEETALSKAPRWWPSARDRRENLTACRPWARTKAPSARIESSGIRGASSTQHSSTLFLLAATDAKILSRGLVG